MARFLVVEDDEQLGDLLSEVCHDLCGADEVLVSTGDTAENLLERESVDLAIIDVLLPEKLGFDVLCRAARRGVPSLLISGHGDADVLCERLDVPYLMKPFSLRTLVEMTEAIRADTRANIARLREACKKLRQTVECSNELLIESKRLQQESRLLAPRSFK